MLQYVWCKDPALCCLAGRNLGECSDFISLPLVSIHSGSHWPIPTIRQERGIVDTYSPPCAWRSYISCTQGLVGKARMGVTAKGEMATQSEWRDPVATF